MTRWACSRAQCYPVLRPVSPAPGDARSVDQLDGATVLCQSSSTHTISSSTIDSRTQRGEDQRSDGQVLTAPGARATSSQPCGPLPPPARPGGSGSCGRGSHAFGRRKVSVGLAEVRKWVGHAECLPPRGQRLEDHRPRHPDTRARDGRALRHRRVRRGRRVFDAVPVVFKQRPRMP